MTTKCVFCEGTGFLQHGLVCQKCHGYGAIFSEIIITLTSVGDPNDAIKALADYYDMDKPSEKLAADYKPGRPVKPVEFMGAKWTMVCNWEAME